MSACRRCGALGRAIEVAQYGTVVAAGTLCDPCFADALDEVALLRVEFDALLAAGLSRETANARMIEKIDGKNGTA